MQQVITDRHGVFVVSATDIKEGGLAHDLRVGERYGMNLVSAVHVGDSIVLFMVKPE